MDSSEASEIIKTYQTMLVIPHSKPGSVTNNFVSFSYNCVGTSGGVLMIYGWLITLDQEVRMFWKRRITGASALFFLTRYTTLVAYSILAFVSLARVSDSVTLFGYDVTGANVLTTGCQGEDSTPQQTSIITITFFNVLDLVLNVISIVSPYNQTAYITGLSDPLTSVLLSQFLLDLQAADRARDTTSVARSGASAGADETLRFASRVMGSLGAPLDPGPGSAAQSTADHAHGRDRGSVLEELCFAPNEEERGGIALADGTIVASVA
ncbi:hypothetical protein BD413DRAFT_615530 [Trametes elegans]|nr:hypothetical protein BD413DRAFT_615530 [Trametes elegans]